MTNLNTNTLVGLQTDKVLVFFRDSEQIDYNNDSTDNQNDQIITR